MGKTHLEAVVEAEESKWVHPKREACMEVIATNAPIVADLLRRSQIGSASGVVSVHIGLSGSRMSVSRETGELRVNNTRVWGAHHPDQSAADMRADVFSCLKHLPFEVIQNLADTFEYLMSEEAPPPPEPQPEPVPAVVALEEPAVTTSTLDQGWELPESTDAEEWPPAHPDSENEADPRWERVRDPHGDLGVCMFCGNFHDRGTLQPLPGLRTEALFCPKCFELRKPKADDKPIPPAWG